MRPLAVYIHWPFCKSKCPYCDFNSSVAANIDHAAIEAVYIDEIKSYASILPERKITSIFFGGGTPSMMAPEMVGRIIEAASSCWRVEGGAEITLEANPNSVDAEKFKGFKSAGVNRLSLGVQSLRDEALQFLGRTHSAAEALRAMELVAKTFPRFSFDLMYARYGQTREGWRDELKETIAFGPKHLSLYQLSVEEGTPFHKQAQAGKSLKIDDETAVQMQEIAEELLQQTAIRKYEVSNYAAAGEESRHNLVYWNYEDYIGIGPGAHGRFVMDGVRYATENARDLRGWTNLVASDGRGAHLNEVVKQEEAKHEALLMGLRLVEGINLNLWENKFNEPLQKFILMEKLKKLEHAGLLVLRDDRLRATTEGMLRLNAVLAELLP